MKSFSDYLLNNLNRILNARFSKFPLILAYHSVGEFKNKEALKCFNQEDIKRHYSSHISLELFKEHISFIRRHRKFISLKEFQNQIHAGKVEKNICVLTFDDAYQSLMSGVMDYLFDEKISSTIFINPALIAQEKLRPMDVILYVTQSEGFASLSSLLEKLNIPNIENNTMLFQQLHSWRHSKEGWQKICDLSQAILDKKNVTATALAETLNLHMSWQELKNCHLDYVAIGNHGAAHLNLALLNEAELQQEIIVSKNKILEQFQMQTLPYAYAFGSPEYLSETAKNIILESHECLLSAYGGLNGSQDHSKEFKRVPMISSPNSLNLLRWMYPIKHCITGLR